MKTKKLSVKDLIKRNSERKATYKSGPIRAPRGQKTLTVKVI